MALTDYYVDPVNGNDTTGDGTSHATAWKTCQKALDTITNGGDGTRINVNDSGTETLSSALSLATFGNPTIGAPLVFQGYTATSGDGGRFTLSGGGSVGILVDATADYTYFADGRLTNCGAAQMLVLDANCGLINMQFDGSSHATPIDLDEFSLIRGCYFTNLTTVNVDGGIVEHCYFLDGATDFTTALVITGSRSNAAFNNVFSLAGAANGITAFHYSIIRNNTIWSNAGTGHGIQDAAGARFIMEIANNIVEGFSGASGVGLDLGLSDCLVYSNNQVFNCETVANAPVSRVAGLTGATTRTASALRDPSNADFRPISAMREINTPSNIGGDATGTIANYAHVGAITSRVPHGIHLATGGYK